MYGYVYMTTNLVNGKKYIGRHVYGDYPNIDKKYLGSGIGIVEAIEKYGPKNFSCRILQWCHSEWELNAREKAWILMYNAVKDRVFYNMTAGGEGFDSLYCTKKSKDMWATPEFRNKIMEIFSSDEYREKQSKIQKSLYENNKTIKNKHKQGCIDSWKHGTKREKQIEAQKKVWENLEYKKEQTERVKKGMQKPDVKEKLSKNQKENWKNPEYIKKQKESHKKVWDNLEYKEKQKKAQKEFRKNNPYAFLKYTQEQVEQVLELLNQGLKQTDITKKLNIPQSTISRIKLGKLKYIPRK